MVLGTCIFIERVDLVLSVIINSSSNNHRITVTIHSQSDSGARDVGEPLEPTSGVITREEYLDGVTAAGTLGQHTRVMSGKGGGQFLAFYFASSLMPTQALGHCMLLSRLLLNNENKKTHSC